MIILLAPYRSVFPLLRCFVPIAGVQCRRRQESRGVSDVYFTAQSNVTPGTIVYALVLYMV